MRFAVFVCAAGLCLAGQRPAPPQPPAEEPPVIRVDVELVNVFFSVRDKSGRFLSSLTKEDFTVLEDGKAQEIRYFTHETDLPLTIGLLVDVSKSQEALIEVEREAAYQFFSRVLRQKDMAFLISFGVESELLQDFTNSPALLRKALGELRLNAGVSVAGPIVNPGPIPTQPRGTVLYEAVFLAADEKLRGEVGRKAIIVITDGNDYGSRIKIEKAIEAAQRSDAIIYSILYEDPRYTSPMYGGFSGTGQLRRMAEETGGRMFRVDRGHPLQEAFDQIQQEMRSQYALAYASSNRARDGGFRKLEIKPKLKDARVQARRGYYASAK